MSLELLQKIEKIRQSRAEKTEDLPATHQVLRAVSESLRETPDETLTKRKINSHNAVPSADDDRSPGKFALTITADGDWETINERINAISEHVSTGNLSDLESMLTEQAVLMNNLFSDLLLSAARAAYVGPKTKMIGTALKTQDACRKTILALNELKNPKRTAFIKQTLNQLNISGELTNGGQTMDSSATKSASSENPQMEAVEIEHRSQD